MFNKDDYFDALNNRKFRFVRMIDIGELKGTLLVWEFNKNEYGMLMETCCNLSPQDVSEEVLKEIGVWDKALYYFTCCENNYEHIWFFEDDVFFYNLDTILNIQ